MNFLLFIVLAMITQGCDLVNSLNEHKSLWPPCQAEMISYVLVFTICNLANATGIEAEGCWYLY